MISNFPSNPLRNRGGYRSFVFIPDFDVAEFPTITNHTIPNSGIVLHTGKAWYQGYATAETLSFADDPDKSGNGTAFNLKVSGLVPGDKPELTNLLFQMEDIRFLVKLTDTRGKLKLIGSQAFPLEFKAVFSSGDQRSSTKGYNIQFYGAALHRALECI